MLTRGRYMPLHTGRKNEVINHHINYLRETDYVSAAVAMVPRRLFIDAGMFDMHFSPGYYATAHTVPAACPRHPVFQSAIPTHTVALCAPPQVL